MDWLFALLCVIFIGGISTVGGILTAPKKPALLPVPGRGPRRAR